MEHTIQNNDDKSQTHTCPICHVEMSVIHYKQFSEDLEENESTFRLECGHAFHSNCLCRALRMEGHNDCPVCRNSGPTRHGITREALDAEFVVNPDGSLSLVFNEIMDEMPETNNLQSLLQQDLQNANRLVEALDRIRRRPNVQEIRRRVNEARRMYRNFESHIVQERHIRMQRMLEIFRRDWHDRYTYHTKRLKRLLKQLHTIENNAIRDEYPTDHESILTSANLMMDDYKLESYIGNRGAFGPLRRKFWHGTE